jgi:putative transposase
MQEIKSVSAHRINRHTGHLGRIWQEESFDRALRNAEDLDLKIEYMIDNPVRAGIVESATTYRWIWVETVDSSAADGTGGAPVPPSRWAV